MESTFDSKKEKTDTIKKAKADKKAGKSIAVRLANLEGVLGI